MSLVNNHSGFEKLQKAGVSAGLATASWIGIQDPTMTATFNVRGTDYPAYVVVALIGAGASLGTTFVSDMFLNHIPKNAKARHLESLFIHVATSSVMYGALPKLLSAEFNMREAREFAFIGAVVEVVSTMINDQLVQLERDLEFIV